MKKKMVPYTNLVELTYISILSPTLVSMKAAGMANVKPVSDCCWKDTIAPNPPICLT